MSEKGESEESIDDLIEAFRQRDADTDARLANVWREQATHSRHYEVLRAQVSSIFFAASGAIFGFAVREPAATIQLWYGVALLIVGGVAFGLSLFYHDSHVFHWTLLQVFRKAYLKGEIRQVKPGSSKLRLVKKLYRLTCDELEQTPRWRSLFLRHYPTEPLWVWVHGFAMFAGAVFVWPTFVAAVQAVTTMLGR